MNNKVFGIADALQSLAPGAQWTLMGENNYSGLNWFESNEVDQPSEEAVNAEIVRLQQEYDSLEYQRLREKEYPDFRDYLDGIVKDDQDQIQKYIDECLAVKEKYPKP